MNKFTANIINSLLAGALVLFGSFTAGEITQKSIIVAIAASFIVAITQFKNFISEYCKSEEEIKTKIFNFINL
jgi:hypothetical protein